MAAEACFSCIKTSSCLLKFTSTSKCPKSLTSASCCQTWHSTLMRSTEVSCTFHSSSRCFLVASSIKDFEPNAPHSQAKTHHCFLINQRGSPPCDSAGLLVELDALSSVLEAGAEWQADAAPIRARMLRILSLVASRYLSAGECWPCCAVLCCAMQDFTDLRMNRVCCNFGVVS